jgi:hypothetical protein
MGYRGAPTPIDRVTIIDSSAPSISKEILGTYSCSHNGKNGKLVLDVVGVHFTSSIGHSKHFSLPYNAINKLEKVRCYSVVALKGNTNAY